MKIAYYELSLKLESIVMEWYFGSLKMMVYLVDSFLSMPPNLGNFIVDVCACRIEIELILVYGCRYLGDRIKHIVLI